MEFSSVEGKLTILGEDGTVLTQNYTGLKEINKVAFHPSKPLVAVCGRETVVLLWEIGKNHPSRVLRGHVGYVNDVCWNQVGDKLVSGSDDGTVRLWTCTGEFVDEILVVPLPIYSLEWVGDEVIAHSQGQSWSCTVKGDKTKNQKSSIK